MKSFHRLKKDVGNAVLAKYDNKCTNCGSKENLCVHHVKKGDVVPNNLPPPGNPYGRRGKKPPIRCIEDGCEILQHGKSLCKKHYEYKRRRGLI